jgi:hypothetical protein
METSKTGLSEESRQKIRQLVHGIRDDVLAIGLAGSLSKGLDNQYSDIDIVCIVKNTFFNRWFGFVDGRPIEIAFVNVNFLDNVTAREMPPYRIYFEAGNYSNIKPLEDEKGILMDYRTKLLELARTPEVRESVIPDYFSTLITKLSGILTAVETKNTYKIIYSSRILAEYSGLLLMAYNGSIPLGQGVFLKQVEELQNLPKDFYRDFMIAGNYANTGDIDMIVAASRRLLTNLLDFLEQNPLNLPYSTQLTSLLAESRPYVDKISERLKETTDKKVETLLR